jgi:CxxC-x17-CxxC domain-containing protein
MHQGNWKCSSCGGAITELPFQPRSEAGLTCRTCYAKQKDKGSQQAPEMPVATEAPEIPDDAGLAGEPAPAEDIGMDTVPVSTEKPAFSGDWKCAGCGAAITSLPFEPRSTNNLKCLDCFKNSKG